MRKLWRESLAEIFDRTDVWRWVILLIATTSLLAQSTSMHLPLDPLRYAALARQMADGGDWIVPRFGDDVYLRKPPLLLWGAAGSYRLFGVTGFATKLPSILLGILTALLTARLARRLADRETAFLSVVVLVTLYTFTKSARTLRLETAVTASMLGAMLVWLEATERPRFPWWGGFAFFGWMSLGVMGKGYPGLYPLALIVFAVPRLRGFLSPWFWLGVLALLVPVGGWLYLVREQLGADWTLAFAADAGQYASGGKWLLMFLKKIPLGFAANNPHWILFIVLGIVAAVRELRRGSGHDRNRARLLLVWVAVVVVVVIPKKWQYTRYLVPACPPLAILAALWLRRRLGSRSLAPVVAGLTATVAVLAIAFFVFPIASHSPPHRYSTALPFVEEYAKSEDRLLFLGKETESRRAAMILHLGRIPECVALADVGGLAGNGRLVLADDKALREVSKEIPRSIVFRGKGFKLLRFD